MEHIFETNTGVGLYFDGDKYISRNPAEVLACLRQDAVSKDFYSRLASMSLMDEIQQKGGIYYSEKEPKRIMSNKQGVFLAEDDARQVFGFASSYKFDTEMFNNLKENKKLLVI